PVSAPAMAARSTAAPTSGATLGPSGLGTIASAASSSAATRKIASAAPSFMFSVITVAPASDAARKIPGKASPLLIWLQTSLRPVATTLAYWAATSGVISGCGLDSANTTGSAAIVASSCGEMVEPDNPRYTSAP